MDMSQLWAGADVIFTVIFILSILIMLYAMALMSREIRLLQYKVSVMETDLRLINEEIKMLGSRGATPASKSEERHKDQQQSS